ncbi:dTDP-4-dehydrorhamnose reductase [Candidatus Falkowbacteria bacterium CG_4_10_14_0_2_um_filter_48_10]|nr:MAG: dTDP-4-dehydrorhamnose reductase [Candidatus Falkowbacteria bacterium CG_4_10_14_0_2_um_filter_48_10]
MRKKVIIFGAQGALGKQLDVRARSDYDVLAWHKGDIDITDEDLVKKKVAAEMPDIIINAAAYNAVDRCEQDEEEKHQAELINGAAVGFLAQAALAAGALFVHFSTDYVFSGDASEPYQENSEPAPLNVYGQSKLRGEKEIIKLSGRGLQWRLIRTARLFGPPGEGEGAKENFFLALLKLSRRQPEIKVIDREEIGSFTYTVDLAAAVFDLLQSGQGAGIYHLANSGQASWFEAAVHFFRSIGSRVAVLPIRSADYPRPARRPLFSVLANTKLPPVRDWQTALDEYISTLKE